MMNAKKIIPLLLLFSSLQSEGRVLARFEVYSGLHERENSVVSAVLANITLPCSFQLYEICHSGYIAIPFQVRNERDLIIWWVISGQTPANNTRYFELRESKSKRELKPLPIRGDSSTYLLLNHNRPVLAYNRVPPKATIAENYPLSRSGFIHPLYSPSGKILTALQPHGHPHHHGIWSAWTSTRFRGREIDFWNLGKQQGRVDYRGTIAITGGDIFTSLKVLQQHVAIDSRGYHHEAINEALEIKVYNLPGDIFMIDHVSTFNCATPCGILLEEFRYGGFVFRGNPTWDPSTVEIITREGKNQSNADGSRAAWCIVQETGKSSSGLLLMSHPGNFNHPEPLRIWEPGANNGKSNIFINFSPIRDRYWNWVQGQTYVLRYRVITFDGRFDNHRAERKWVDFAYPPEVTILLND